MTVINTNVNALQATAASNSAAAMTSQAMTRLSTGLRINSASDDAAGLAIATSMTSQINGMNQGIKNANDGISLAQTAEGSLTEVTNMLQRIRELAVQSSSGTYSSTDRDQMQQEVTSLTGQISNIITSTKFNGVNLFSSSAGASGSGVSFNIQAGANNLTTDQVKITASDFDSSQFGTASASYTGTTATVTGFQVNDNVTTTGGTTTYDGHGADYALKTIDNVDSMLANVAKVDASFGAGQSQLQSSVNNMTNSVTNLSAARSRIEDTDYSAESTAMAKAQILSQASTAMIAQANQSQQNVLTLLK
ncbi:flagellin N-terminal helical domain-containing protein [Novosphingobium terrae]|uniref:flagellin N-terminal helical domain-containing protein n=1 Tax=Novosphingobium terrae TaxID=2726189 RepID=UPI00197F5747|nr:flagellin [Novosphingobium terrae]